jgi:hypothetical protein
MIITSLLVLQYDYLSVAFTKLSVRIFATIQNSKAMIVLEGIWPSKDIEARYIEGCSHRVSWARTRYEAINHQTVVTGQ